jgi:hypothetical protein
MVTSNRFEILANQIGLGKVIIVPNNVPPHRPQPEATSAQRKQMLALAIADKPLFVLDERELRRRRRPGRRKRSKSGDRNKGRTSRWRSLLARTRCSPSRPGTITPRFWIMSI